jgi:hypothetical protein
MELRSMSISKRCPVDGWKNTGHETLEITNPHNLECLNMFNSSVGHYLTAYYKI